jgi:hypothetical protein
MSQYLLPVSKEERALWTHKIPEGIHVSSDDYVSFHATGGDVASWHHPEPEAPNFPYEACYAACMPNYDDFEFICYPENDSSAKISLEQAHEFFSIMSGHGIVPEGIRLWEEVDEKYKGIFCRIGAGLGNPHQYYAALTCYRWMDCHAPLVWEFLQIMNDGSPRHPMQILPHMVIKWACDWNHSFILSCAGGELSVQAVACNPLVGVAGKIYFDQNDPRGKYDFEVPSSEVNVAIEKIAAELTETIPLKKPQPWNKKFVNKVPKYAFDETVDACHPGLYELYTIPNITKEQAGSILAKLFTKEVEP